MAKPALLKNELRITASKRQRILEDPGSKQVMYRPVLQEEIPSTPDPSGENYLEQLEWWEEQIRRCKYGWVAPDGHYINPIYYFYLNFVKIFLIDILDTNRAKWDSPYYRKSDEMIFDKFWYCMPKRRGNESVNATNLFVSKGRRKAWSTSELYGLNMYLFVFFQEYDMNRAYPDARTQRKERRRFVKCYEFLHDIFRRNKKGEPLEIVIDNQEEVAQGVKGKARPQNTVFFYTVSKDSGAVRGDALICVTIIEAGKWSGNLNSFIMSAEETLALGTVKFGFTLMGGTSDAINNTDTDYRDLCFNPGDYNAIDHFIPAYQAYGEYIDYYTGEDLKEEALRVLVNRRRELEKSKNSKSLAMFIQENPFQKEEAFIPATMNEYPQAKIDQQYARILRGGLMKQWMRGRFEFEVDYTGNLMKSSRFVEHAEGNWWVHESALIRVPYSDLHVAGSDSYYKDVIKDKRPTSSKGAMVIWRKPTTHPISSDMPVAIYLGRPENREILFEEWLQGLRYFDAVDLHEHITEDWYKYLVLQGEGARYRYLPGGQGADPRGVFGDLTSLGLRFFSANRHLRITHLQLMDSFRFWAIETNSDLASAMHQVLWHLSLVEEKATIALDSMPQTPVITFSGSQESFVDADSLSFGVRGFA